MKVDKNSFFPQEQYTGLLLLKKIKIWTLKENTNGKSFCGSVPAMVF